MMFKNLSILRLTADINGSGETLTEKPARNPGVLEMSASGWGHVCPKSEMLIHQLDGCSIVCLEKREKLLPGSVIRDEINLRVEKVELEEGRTVNRRERATIRDEALVYLLPLAFIKTTRTMALIDHESNLLVVDTPSKKKAEDLISLLRETMGGLPMIYLETEKAPQHILTSMIASELSQIHWEVGADAVLCDPAHASGAIRIKNLDQTVDEIRSHSEAGRQVKELEVSYQDRIGFIITDQLLVKRLKFLDLVQAARDDIECDDEASRFDADMHIMIAELRTFIPAMLHLFGGEVDRISK